MVLSVLNANGPCSWSREQAMDGPAITTGPLLYAVLLVPVVWTRRGRGCANVPAAVPFCSRKKPHASAR